MQEKIAVCAKLSCAKNGPNPQFQPLQNTGYFEIKKSDIYIVTVYRKLWKIRHNINLRSFRVTAIVFDDQTQGTPSFLLVSDNKKPVVNRIETLAIVNMRQTKYLRRNTAVKCKKHDVIFMRNFNQG